MCSILYSYIYIVNEWTPVNSDLGGHLTLVWDEAQASSTHQILSAIGNETLFSTDLHKLLPIPEYSIFHVCFMTHTLIPVLKHGLLENLRKFSSLIFQLGNSETRGFPSSLRQDGDARQALRCQRGGDADDHGARDGRCRSRSRWSFTQQNHHFSWEKSRFRLGHGFNIYVTSYQRVPPKHLF